MEKAVRAFSAGVFAFEASCRRYMSGSVMEI
jgi:hypothetical protein